MRHRFSHRHFNRKTPHRLAMFKNMVNSLVEHETIRTTVTRAKDLRGFIEPMITKAKQDSVANRRHVFAELRSKSAVSKLFTDLGPHYKDRPGGYLRILKCGYRSGDNAPMAIVQLVDRGQEGEEARASD